MSEFVSFLRVLHRREGNDESTVQAKQMLLSPCLIMEQVMLTPHHDPASQLPPGVSLPVTIQADASAGSAINTAATIPSATSSPISEPSCPTEINNTGSRTAITVGVAVGVPLGLLAAGLAALLVFEKRKFRGIADGSSMKDPKYLVDTTVRNQASHEPRAGEARMKHTMTTAMNGIYEKEHREGLRSHGRIEELGVGGRDGRVELG